MGDIDGASPRLAADLALPLEAVTRKVAIVGQSSSDKSDVAPKLAEAMLRAGTQVIALDPTGVW